MAKYTQKTEADLAWDKLRREVEYRMNLMAAHMKARLKNEILPQLQERFEQELLEGRILKFEQTADLWLEEALQELNA